jgi:multicomponent Na+:H+ antiporter subunit A
VRSESRFGSITALGVTGYAVALLYVLFGAPDLAITQFLVETLIVILLVFVFRRLPRFARFTGTANRIRDGLFAAAVGALMTILVFGAVGSQSNESVSAYFSDNSLIHGHGRNVVNVILVDFRGLDTLGEITVLSVAGLGVYALLKLRSQQRRP